MYNGTLMKCLYSFSSLTRTLLVVAVSLYQGASYAGFDIKDYQPSCRHLPIFELTNYSGQPSYLIGVSHRDQTPFALEAIEALIRSAKRVYVEYVSPTSITLPSPQTPPTPDLKRRREEILRAIGILDQTDGTLLLNSAEDQWTNLQLFGDIYSQLSSVDRSLGIEHVAQQIMLSLGSDVLSLERSEDRNSLNESFTHQEWVNLFSALKRFANDSILVENIRLLDRQIIDFVANGNLQKAHATMTILRGKLPELDLYFSRIYDARDSLLIEKVIKNFDGSIVSIFMIGALHIDYDGANIRAMAAKNKYNIEAKRICIK